MHRPFSTALLCGALTAGALPTLAQNATDDATDRAAVCDGHGSNAAIINACSYVIDRASRSKPLAEALGNRAAAYTATGKLDDALQDLNQAIAIDGENPGLFIDRAMVLSEQGDKARAISDLNAAVRLAPQDSEPYVARANLNLEINRGPQAEDDFNQALALDPENDDALSGRGFYYLDNGAPDKAIADFSAVISHDPKDTDAYFKKALAEEKSGRDAAALSDYTQVIAQVPDEPLAYNSAAWLLATAPDEADRNGARAVEWARKAVDLDNDVIGYKDTLAAALAETGDFDGAAQMQSQVVEALKSQSPETDITPYQERLDLYRAGQPYHQTR